MNLDRIVKELKKEELIRLTQDLIRIPSVRRGGEKEENAAIAMHVLEGHDGASREIVVANAAFGIYVAGKAGSIPEAVDYATESIDSGNALRKLNGLRELSNRA